VAHMRACVGALNALLSWTALQPPPPSQPRRLDTGRLLLSAAAVAAACGDPTVLQLSAADWRRLALVRTALALLHAALPTAQAAHDRGASSAGSDSAPGDSCASASFAWRGSFESDGLCSGLRAPWPAACASLPNWGAAACVDAPRRVRGRLSWEAPREDARRAGGGRRAAPTGVLVAAGRDASWRGLTSTAILDPASGT